jgi:alginate O-acetyltransferase complex protein AlgI
MLFNSYLFIFVFLPITLLGFYFISRKTLQLSFLLACSIFFYAYWSTTYVFFLLFTVVLDFYVARTIFKTTDVKKRKLLLFTSMFINLSILGFFKYYNLLANTINSLVSTATSYDSIVPVLSLILPIGISFYTFQSMSYVIDVYRKKSDAHANLLSFAGYVTLFPHQISGPLVRHNQIVPQLENPQTYFFHRDHFWKGCAFFILGLSKKILIADLLALIVSPLVTNMKLASNLEAWLAILGYSMQLYFDFSGYSDMAVGLGLMMNIQFPQNFNSPYKSKSITEFWRRWHITLSNWLRDYLYISLGGNRKGRLHTYRNLILTMTIGGLWHGGSWTFAIWGFYHGCLLLIEKVFTQNNWQPLKNKYLKVFLTFIIVNIGWVFFRSPDYSVVKIWLAKIAFLTPRLTWDVVSLPERYKDRFFIALGVSFILTFLFKNTWEINLNSSKAKAVSLGFLFALCLMYMGDESPFLYFQF